MNKIALHGGTPVRSPDNFLVFGAPQIGNEEVEEVVSCLHRRWIGTGPLVSRFEADFAHYKGDVKNSIALNSCTAALHLSLIAAGIGPGDEVITTPMTFCATVNAIIHSGAKPVLADCDPRTMNIDSAEVEKKITSKTKAILPVHFAGRCCDMAPLMSLAEENNLIVIEDCAHAVESEYKGRKAGTFGTIGCFSFYVTKNVVAGEGGMVITDDDQIASTIKILGLHGLSKDAWKRFSDEGYKHYQVMYAGYKYNMTDMQAALGIHQLRRVEENWLRRKKIWDSYNDAFRDLPCILPADPEPDTRHALHLYTPLLDIDRLNRDRDWVLKALTAENVGIGVHYLPVHLHPYYQDIFSWKVGDYPNAEWIGQRTLSLPLSAAVDDNDVDDVINAFRKVLNHIS